MKHNSESVARAAEFARRLALTGMGATEFQRASGLTRNVIYNLSKGQKPTSEAMESQINGAFNRLVDESTRN
jgi:hypothetical protein